MREHCAQCLAVVETGRGHETPKGETLCGPCYLALWGPQANRRRALAITGPVREIRSGGPRRRRQQLR